MLAGHWRNRISVGIWRISILPCRRAWVLLGIQAWQSVALPSSLLGRQPQSCGRIALHGPQPTGPKNTRSTGKFATAMLSGEASCSDKFGHIIWPQRLFGTAPQVRDPPLDRATGRKPIYFGCNVGAIQSATVFHCHHGITIFTSRYY